MIRVELVKLVLRPRTWVILGMLVALPTLVAILLAVTDIAPAPGEGPPFLSAVLSDGTLFPLAALGVVLPLFLPIAVAVLGGDAVAGEVQSGTLRYLLVRPASRLRLLVAKLVTVVAFVVLAVLVVAAVAAVEGRLLLGTAPAAGTVSLSGSTLSPQQLAVAHGARPRVHGRLHARRGGGGAVPVDGQQLLDRRRARHRRCPDRLDRAARPRRRPGAAPVPADALLARVRGPVPGPDPVGRRRARPARPARLPGRLQPRRLGELLDLRRRRAESLSPLRSDADLALVRRLPPSS